MPLKQTAPISDEQIRLLVDSFHGKVEATKLAKYFSPEPGQGD